MAQKILVHTRRVDPLEPDLNLCLNTLKSLTVFRTLPALCFVVFALASTQANAERPWVEWQGGHFRISALKEMSCRSPDGVRCARADESPPKKRTALSETIGLHTLFHQGEYAEWRSLSCGLSHADHYGISGYDQTDHWCNTAYANLFAEWKDYRPLGIDKLLASTPDGRLMCHSFDGINCSTPDEVEREQRRKVPPSACPKKDVVPSTSSGVTIAVDPACGLRARRTVKPLVCGAHHRAVWGDDGFSRPRHWCRAPEILRYEQFDDLVLNEWTTKNISMPEWHPSGQPGVIVMASVGFGSRLSMQLPVYTAQQKNLSMGMLAGGPEAPAIQATIGANVAPIRELTVRPGSLSTWYMMRLSATGTMCYHAWGYGDRGSWQPPKDSSSLIAARHGWKRPWVTMPAQNASRDLQLSVVNGYARIHGVMIIAARRLAGGSRPWFKPFYTDECDGLRE